jgi:hypothetical protein
MCVCLFLCSQIETENLLIHLVEQELSKRTVMHFFTLCFNPPLIFFLFLSLYPIIRLYNRLNYQSERLVPVCMCVCIYVTSIYYRNDVEQMICTVSFLISTFSLTLSSFIPLSLSPLFLLSSTNFFQKSGEYKGKKFNGISYFFGYQARGSLPSIFDCDYAYVIFAFFFIVYFLFLSLPSGLI